MRYIFLLTACLCSAFAHCKSDTFSQGRLEGFYEQFFLEEKQKLATAGLTGPYVSFWVSPSGNDANPGTQQDPFLTLQRARDAVRALPSSAFKEQDIFVYLEDGTYRLEQPLVLSGADSGQKGHDVVYSAAPGARPIISGAVQVTGWSPSLSTPGVYQARVNPYMSRQLYVNGTRATRARTTAYPTFFLPQWTASAGNGGIQYVVDPSNPASWQDPLSWTNQQEIEAVILTQWKMMRVPVSSISGIPTVSGEIAMQQPAWNNSNVYFDVNTGMPGEWSFWQVTWFENAYEFLTEPGQWYLDSTGGYLYYIPLPGEDMSTADVELPILETLIVGEGTLQQPVHNIRFEGLTFSYATWLGSSSSDGYVSDQSAQLLVGPNHPSNVTGHDQNVVPTPGNISFAFANNIVFYGNIFEHLGAVSLQLGTGSVGNTISSNLFTDISSSAIEIGGVTAEDSHPSNPKYILNKNLVTNNLIGNVAVEYQDAAGIFVGFSQNTTISNNTIANVPWSGIAMGWGWGLLDVGSFPGLGSAYSGEWGTFTSPTPNSGCKILRNQISNFLDVLWDGGAIYTTGQQGPSLSKGLLIQGNVAFGKRPSGGGNTFYTDGGSRYIQLDSNASYNNPIGVTYYGPPPSGPIPYPNYAIQNGVPYGSDSGGCRTYGDISYSNNYWLEAPIPANIEVYNGIYHLFAGFYPYIGVGFNAVCPYTANGVTYPVNLGYQNNHFIFSTADIPQSLLSNAGVQNRPPSIPPSLWVVPPP